MRKSTTNIERDNPDHDNRVLTIKATLSAVYHMHILSNVSSNIKSTIIIPLLLKRIDQ